MSRRKIDCDSPFPSINGAVFRTGLSAGFIRRGCKDGSIPHIRVGKDYRINMKLWLRQLDEQSKGGVHSEQ